MIKKIVNSIINYSCPDEDDKETKRRVSSLILVWLSTTIIMWFYVLFSYFVYDITLVGNLGIIYSFIHTLTPLIYRYSRSFMTAGLNISISALFFQVTFAIFNDGIHSPSVIWLTAHPVIMSFFGSRRLILISISINICVIAGLIYLGRLGFFPPDLLPSSYTDVMRVSSLIGLDVVIATYTIVFIKTTQQGEEELAARNSLIEGLIRIISHDINNALTISIITNNMLNKHVNNDQQEINQEFILEKLKKLENSHAQMKEITTSILQWMKTNDGTFPLKQEVVSVDELFRHTQEYFDELLKEKDIQLIIEKPEQDLFICADALALKNQVINNILSNAIKFSASNSKIFFTAVPNEDSIELIIKDQGIGIPEDLKNNVFDPTHIKSRRGTAGENGTGFGLTIVKNIIESMQGSITLCSETKTEVNPVSGTTITVTLPLC